ncbi:N-acetylmuramoyl-L-alanine amidase [Sphingomonas natans]|uniref:N-acetylmuramoyl-L-alanine amidase n=1 Tax=Sphingomonas natans TaxID=3063330 RepID=UPI0026E22A95|nr:N-acetylmuramoyl-L-alanine amidase [Sphingomonas sp. BIUV-7]
MTHFTAHGGGDLGGDANWFRNKQAQAAAHVWVGRDKTPKQATPFTMRTWHADVSSWGGRRNGTEHSIGIEVDTWQRLATAADTRTRSFTGALVGPARAAFLQFKQEQAPRYGDIYAEAQLDLLADGSRMGLLAYPSTTQSVGQSVIAPPRKVDPGPAFPDEPLRQPGPRAWQCAGGGARRYRREAERVRRCGPAHRDARPIHRGRAGHGLIGFTKEPGGKPKARSAWAPSSQPESQTRLGGEGLGAPSDRRLIRER